jgi:hypothetical protein
LVPMVTLPDVAGVQVVFFFSEKLPKDAIRDPAGGADHSSSGPFGYAEPCRR